MAGMFHAASISAPARVELVLVWVLLALTWLTVVVRFYIRSRIIKSLGWDDGFMLVTLLCFTSYCAFILVIISRGGFTKTQWIITIPKTLTFIMLSELFYVLTTTFLKLSLALFFMRILIQPWQRVIFYVVLTITTIYGMLYSALAIFQCGLPSELLIHVVERRGCVSKGLFMGAGYTYAAMNVLSDWTFVVVPLFMLRKSAMDKRSKTSVGIIMLLGAVGSISSIVRIVYMQGLWFTPDFFYEAANIAIWSTVEPGTAIIAGSFATFRPLLRWTLHFVRRTTHGNSSGSWNGTQIGQKSAPMEQINEYSHHQTNTPPSSPSSEPYIAHDEDGSIWVRQSMVEKRVSDAPSAYTATVSSKARQSDLTDMSEWDKAIDELEEEDQPHPTIRESVITEEYYVRDSYSSYYSEEIGIAL